MVKNILADTGKIFFPNELMLEMGLNEMPENFFEI